MSGNMTELPLMNRTESRSVSALTTLCQCAADAEQTMDIHVINQTYRQKYFEAGYNLTHYLQLYSRVRRRERVCIQDRHGPYSNLLILLFFKNIIL